MWTSLQAILRMSPKGNRVVERLMRLCALNPLIFALWLRQAFGRLFFALGAGSESRHDVL